MTLDEQVLLLTHIVRLIDEMQKTDNYLGKDEVISHLQIASEHVSREIWVRSIHGNYGNND